MTDYNNRYSPREEESWQGNGSASRKQPSYYRSSYWQNRDDDRREDRYGSYRSNDDDGGYGRKAYSGASYRDDGYGYAPRQTGRRYSDDYDREDYRYTGNSRVSRHEYAEDYRYADNSRHSGYTDNSRPSRYGNYDENRRNGYGYAGNSRYQDYGNSYSRPDYYGYSDGGQSDVRRRGAIVFGLLAFDVIAVIALIIMLVNLGSDGTKVPGAEVYPTATPVVTPTTVPTQMPVSTQTPVPVVTATPASATVAAMAPLSEYTVLDGIPGTDRELGLAACAQVPDDYFNDTVFIGDSVTLKLNYFVRDNRKEYPTLLGNAQFLTAGSLGSGNALKEVSSDSLHPAYQGQKMALEDAVAAMGAKKVYIMLGMNDIALYGVEESAENMMRLIARIVSKSPGVQVFVQSATPRIEGEYNKLNNDALFRYNLKLYEYCLQYTDNGIYFVDVAHVMRDEKGNLPLDYCSDATGMGLHFTDKGCKAWIEFLYTHALVQ